MNSIPMRLILTYFLPIHNVLCWHFWKTETDFFPINGYAYLFGFDSSLFGVAGRVVLYMVAFFTLPVHITPVTPTSLQ